MEIPCKSRMNPVDPRLKKWIKSRPPTHGLLIGTLSKLTRRPRGGGQQANFSIQKDSQRPSEFSRPLTSITFKLNGDLNVTASSRPPRQFAQGP